MENSFKLIYESPNCIGDCGEYATPQEATKAAIRMCRENPTLNLSYYHIANDCNSHVYHYVLPPIHRYTISYKEYEEVDGEIKSNVISTIGTVNSIYGVNDLIINDIENVHKDATLCNYSVTEEIVPLY